MTLSELLEELKGIDPDTIPEKNGGKMTKKCPSSPSPAPSFSAPS